jgi:hypothetical protein
MTWRRRASRADRTRALAFGTGRGDPRGTVTRAIQWLRPPGLTVTRRPGDPHNQSTD